MNEWIELLALCSNLRELTLWRKCVCQRSELYRSRLYHLRGPASLETVSVTFEKETDAIQHLTSLFVHTPNIKQLDCHISWGTKRIREPAFDHRIALHKLERLYLYAHNDSGPTHDDLLSFLFDDVTLANVSQLALARPITFLEQDRHALELMRNSIQTFEVFSQTDWLHMNEQRVRPWHLHLFPNLRTFIGDPYGNCVATILSLSHVLSPVFPRFIEHVHIPVVPRRVTGFGPIDLARLRESNLRKIDLVIHEEYEPVEDEDESFDEEVHRELQAQGRARCQAVQAQLATIGITMTMTNKEERGERYGPEIFRVD